MHVFSHKREKACAGCGRMPPANPGKIVPVSGAKPALGQRSHANSWIFMPLPSAFYTPFPGLATQVRAKLFLNRVLGRIVARSAAAKERRNWDRLPLAIPIFVRGRDDQGKEFLEFATALNLSAGGVLLALSRALPVSSGVSLEVPSAPLANDAHLPRAVRRLRARVVHARSCQRHQLVGLKFSRSLLD